MNLTTHLHGQTMRINGTYIHSPICLHSLRNDAVNKSRLQHTASNYPAQQTGTFIRRLASDTVVWAKPVKWKTETSTKDCKMHRFVRCDMFTARLSKSVVFRHIMPSSLVIYTTFRRRLIPSPTTTSVQVHCGVRRVRMAKRSN